MPEVVGVSSLSVFPSVCCITLADSASHNPASTLNSSSRLKTSTWFMSVRSLFLPSLRCHTHTSLLPSFPPQHMMMQLEILPDWTDWVVQRAGSPGGPPTEEYEITESELDW